MKLNKPENENYAATVVRLKNIVPLEGRDFVVGTQIFGFQAIVSKDSKVGDIGIVFPALTQLSEEYTRLNNLHRHGNLNEDESVTGYISDSRRIKAEKFFGHRSSCLFMPLESVAYTGVDINDFEEGDTFDNLNGHEICKKFVVKPKGTQKTLEKNKNKFIRVDEKHMPKHYETSQYLKTEHIIPTDRNVVVTQKLHGTSIRIGNTIVRRKLSFAERALRKVGVNVAETEVDYVFGSKNVIKDKNNPNQNHFYGTDIYTEEGKKLEGIIPENFVIYGELVGYISDGMQIQKNYTYNVPNAERELYVYRVAFVNSQGRIFDLSWEQVKEFCRDLGLKHVPELWTGKKVDFVAEDWLDKNYFEEGFVNALPLSKDSPVDEGVCVRVDGLAPTILKLKSPAFFEHESAMQDKGVVDLEEVAA